MQIKRLSDEVFVAGQLRPEDVAELAAAGFRSIICNRPDGEEAGQPTFGEIEAAARQADLQVLYLPVVPGRIGAGDVAAFGEALASMAKPVLAYCRSGGRSAALWNRSQVEGAAAR